MNKISPLAFTLCLALAGMQVSAENWIKTPMARPHGSTPTPSVRSRPSPPLTCVWNSPISPSYPPWSSIPRKTPGAPPRLSPVTKTEKSSTRKRKKILTTAGTSSCPAPMERICTGIMWKRPCPRLTRSGNSFTKTIGAQPSPLTQILSVIKMAMPTSGLPWKSLIRKRIYPGSFTG